MNESEAAQNERLEAIIRQQQKKIAELEAEIKTYRTTFGSPVWPEEPGQADFERMLESQYQFRS